MVKVAVFVLLGSFARAAKEGAIAYRYGVSVEVDAYLFVFNLVSWPVGVWFSVLTVVLVPLAARIRAEVLGEVPRFRAELLGLALALGFSFAVLGWLGMPLLLQSSWVGLPLSTVEMAKSMAPLIVLIAPLGVLISLFSAWMLTAHRHANTLLESIPALILLFALVAFPGGEVESLVWGTLAGFFLHLVSVAVPMARCSEIEAPIFTRQSPEWPAFWRGFGVMLVGSALMGLTSLVDQFFAAHLGTGAIATLSYANRILALILSMGATVVSRATLPVFSQAQVHRAWQLRRVATHWGLLLFILGVIAMVVGWWLAPWGVKLLFERGAFNRENTELVATVLRWGLPGLPFYFASLVLVSLLVSQRKYHLLSLIGVLNLLVKIICNFLIVPYFGVNGLMISNSVMMGISCLALIGVVYKDY
jgi:peptidoglycan biosynthesis protein MviN/MurJ (putative lipid II flippase)